MESSAGVLRIYSQVIDSEWVREQSASGADDLWDSVAPQLQRGGAPTEATIRSIGRVGAMQHCALLQRLLGRCDSHLVPVVEDALWMIWLRAGSTGGSRRLRAAIRMMRDGQFERAELALADVVRDEPSFVEPHNQRGLALYFVNRFDDAADCFRMALRCNPYHYAAACALGHVCVAEQAYGAALHAYRMALRIHPRLTEIERMIDDLTRLAPS